MSEKIDIVWNRLTKEQIHEFGLSTYDGEAILIDSRGPSEYENRFHFNAQEFFSDLELNMMEIYKNKT